MRSRRTRLPITLALVIAGSSACTDRPESVGGGAGGQLNLVQALGGARVSSSPAPPAVREQLRWSFPEDRGAWRELSVDHTQWLAAVSTQPLEDALRISISKPPVQRAMFLLGGLYQELEGDLRLHDWEAVRIRARTQDRFAGLSIAHNLEAEGAIPTSLLFFESVDQAPPLFSDGSEQTYVIPIEPRDGEGEGAPFESLGLVAAAVKPAALEVLSIELVPRGSGYPDDYGVRHVLRAGESRTTLFAHAPASIRYTLDVVAGSRLDFGVTAEEGESVRYRVAASSGDEESRVLFDEVVSAADSWQQRSIDLSELAGSGVELELAAASERAGAVGLWGAPVISGPAAGSLPNVVFYVIDGGGADLMSLYGYDRPTTPLLETLAEEGVVFERAYSNSTWTQPSTVSFMTSLHHSVLGGLRRGIHSTPVPAAATTMAEHFGRAGYLTASFTANPNAGRLIGLERGVDILRDGKTEHHSTSSKDLHEAFWQLRERYPGGPWWVHFQTTDVHEPNQPQAPFSGRLVSADRERQLRQWDQQLFRAAGEDFGRTSIEQFYRTALARSGIDRRAYFDTRRGLYDETMMHQDEQLARLVEDLEASGLWQRTLLVIGSDHGHPAGSFARFGRGLIEPQPEPWQGALFDAYSTRVPLLFIWPGEIEGGRRFEEPVSMIDVLPTVLELVGLPRPEVLQGQSLAKLLTGGGRQRLRPVILDEFRMDDDSGGMIGNLEIIDGRWGASLEIGPEPELRNGRHAVPAGGRWGAFHEVYPDVPRLLLYDLESDPFATHAVNGQHPELVEKYRGLLLERWQAHRALAGRFEEAGDTELTPEQLHQLRTLGYIQ